MRSVVVVDILVMSGPNWSFTNVRRELIAHSLSLVIQVASSFLGNDVDVPDNPAEVVDYEGCEQVLVNGDAPAA